ncbi:MAG TPA: PhoH family protein [Alphaproteobacteria bacterium]|nr:PhoH family protein [Alphaproteobacteria bacterium]
MGSKSGLVDAIEILRDIPEIKMIEFSHADVVRHPLVTRVVRAYDQREGRLLDKRPS